MPKAQQKVLIKLGVLGSLAMLVFNYPLLSLYRGYWGAWPIFYVVLFGVWAGFIGLTYLTSDRGVHRLSRAKPERDRL